MFQCRDEGPLRAPVRWSRANGLFLPHGSRDIGGRLEMPNIKVNMHILSISPIESNMIFETTIRRLNIVAHTCVKPLDFQLQTPGLVYLCT